MENTNLFDLEYLTDSNGQPKAVVVPIDLWKRLFLEGVTSIAELSEAIEEYCLNRAMDEALESPLLNREEALAYLES